MVAIAESRELLKRVIAVAKKGRCSKLEELGSDLQRHQELELIKEVTPLLPDYSSEKLLDETVADFAFEVMDGKESILDLYYEERGKKESKPLYRVIGEEGKELMVVKAFPLLTPLVGDFIRELSGGNLLNSLLLEKVKGVLPLAVGKCIVRKSAFLLLAEEAAPGERLDHLFAREGEGRVELAKKLGAALAKIHTKERGAEGTIPRYRLEKIAMRVSLNLKLLEEHPMGLDCAGLLSHFVQLMDEVESMRYPYAFHHGDPHLHNIFFDAEKDLFTFIDSPEIHQSVDQKGKPIGFPAHDFVVAEENLKRLQLFGVEEEFCEELLEAYEEGYQEVSGGLPEDLFRELLELTIYLFLLGKYADWEKIENQEEREEAKQLFTYAKSYFE